MLYSVPDSPEKIASIDETLYSGLRYAALRPFVHAPSRVALDSFIVSS